jgi:DNA polymerase I-like protein with 3'-5' exonuclease and polymerase domains
MGEIMDAVSYYRGFGPSVVCDPLLQIHDELVFELTPGIAPDFLEDCRRILTTCIRPMSVPVRASVAIGDDWGQLK